jgi:CRP-like cAMP-binding protein
MISPEILRRYPFFARLSIEQLNKLAELANEEIVETDHFFFHEENELDHFYLVLEGAVAIVFELPERDVEHKISDQFLRKLKTKDVVTSTVGPGELFGWAGLVPPHCANAGAKALTPCRVIAFDRNELLKNFDEDPRFGYLMMQRTAQAISGRLRDLRIESLAYAIE